MRLNPDNNTSHNDYINASYVDVSSMYDSFFSKFEMWVCPTV